MNTYPLPHTNAWSPRSDRAAPVRLAIAGALALLFALVLASPAAALQQKLTANDGAANAYRQLHRAGPPRAQHGALRGPALAH